MFFDRARIYVKSGDGGDGCRSFYRGKHLRHPRPDGGDGGDGGDVIIRADKSVHTLLDFHYQRHFRGGSGKHGSGNGKRGENGKDCVILAPPGTIVKDSASGELLRDLVKAGDEVVIVQGAEGGHGNRKGREATPGGLGDEKELYLELKLVAELGLVGYPNAGKSSMITIVSNAKSKVAGYPFTTKHPVLGVIKKEGQGDLVIADIPGLLEGAHEGRGLGLEFLRHIERTRVLVHMLDMAAVEGRDPLNDYKTLNRELAFYDAALSKKIQILVANKMDLPGAEENLKKFRTHVRKKIHPVSCLTKEGIDDLLKAVFKVCKRDVKAETL